MGESYVHVAFNGLDRCSVKGGRLDGLDMLRLRLDNGTDEGLAFFLDVPNSTSLVMRLLQAIDLEAEALIEKAYEEGEFEEDEPPEREEANGIWVSVAEVGIGSLRDSTLQLIATYFVSQEEPQRDFRLAWDPDHAKLIAVGLVRGLQQLGYQFECS